jgi:hypothetical protein
MPVTRLSGHRGGWQGGDMEQQPHIHINAVDLRGRLIQLHAERSETAATGLAEIPSYMSDLQEEIVVTRQLYVLTAVTEIAELRAELFGAQHG